VDEAKLEAFMGQAVTDLGATISGLLVHIGDELGLYKAMAGAGPLSAADVASRAGCDRRYVEEWLGNQAAGGYVTYDAGSDRYELPEEQALALADEDSPVFLPGGYAGMVAAFKGVERYLEAFRSGGGVGWHEQDARLFRGTERFFRPGYKAHLVPEWIPALDGVEAKLRAGATVADVGCGHGASTVLLAEAFPASSFVGFDYHEASVETARKRASDAGVADRVRFEVCAAKEIPAGGFDVLAYFDCLHDMGDPEGAVRRAREVVADDGTVLLVEPHAADTVEGNLNPVGRAFYGFSTVICTMASKAQEVGLALGAQAGEERWRRIFTDAGFSQFRRATETPFNLVLEARP
jgi:ubiquinone/menaquinone biosynthesis C-methylase UbiE